MEKINVAKLMAGIVLAIVAVGWVWLFLSFPAIATTLAIASMTTNALLIAMSSKTHQERSSH